MLKHRFLTFVNSEIKPICKVLVFLIVSLVLFTDAVTAETIWKSSSKKVPLIELFSSEGCSSCPPAENWMAKLIYNVDHFVKFTPINFHVDYWNQLGWVDRFSKAQFTDRQKQYATLWGSGRIYTPAFVVDAQESGSTGSFEFLKQNSASEPGSLTVKRKSSTTFEVTFDSKAKVQFDVHFAELANGLKTAVTKGENEGKTLTHNFVVIRLTTSAIENKKSVFNLLEAKKESPQINAFAVWVTEKGSLKPVQSLGGTL